MPVHQYVDPRVQKGCQVGVTRRIELYCYSSDERNRRVVEDVEERDLSIRLAEHEDERIQEFPVFLVIKKPKSPLQQAICAVIQLSTADVAYELAVLVAELVEQDANPTDAGEDDARQVVELHEEPGVVGLPLSHPQVKDHKCGKVKDIPIEQQATARAHCTQRARGERGQKYLRVVTVWHCSSPGCQGGREAGRQGVERTGRPPSAEYRRHDAARAIPSSLRSCLREIPLSSAIYDLRVHVELRV